MHRSGTSAVASMLLVNGGWAGDDHELIGPAPSNVGGFFERRDLVALHDSWLDRLNGSWDSPPGHFDVADERLPVDEASRYLKALLARRPAGAGLVLKDPRMALFLSKWLAVEPAAAVVLPVRHPVEVAESLWRRDKIPFSQAAAMWQKYTIEALVALRGRRVVVVNFSRLVELARSKPEEHRRAVGELIELAWQQQMEPAAQRQTFRVDVVNHGMRAHGMEVLDRQLLPAVVRETWDRLERLPVVAEVAADDLLSGIDVDAGWGSLDRTLAQWRDAGQTLTQLRQTELRLVEAEERLTGAGSSDVQQAGHAVVDTCAVQVLGEILGELRTISARERLPELPAEVELAPPIDDHRPRVAELETELVAAGHREVAVQRELDDAWQTLFEQDEEIGELRATVVEVLVELTSLRESTARQLGGAAEQFDRRMTVLGRTQDAPERAEGGADELRQTARAPQQLVVAGEERIGELSAVLERADDDHEARQMLDEAGTELQRISAQLDVERAQRADLETSLRQSAIAEAEVQQTLSAIVRNYRRVDQVLTEVLTSRSWRLTAPFRRDRQFEQGN